MKKYVLVEVVLVRIKKWNYKMNRQKQIMLAKDIVKYIYKCYGGERPKISVNEIVRNIVRIISRYGTGK